MSSASSMAAASAKPYPDYLASPRHYLQAVLGPSDPSFPLKRMGDVKRDYARRIKGKDDNEASQSVYIWGEGLKRIAPYLEQMQHYAYNDEEMTPRHDDKTIARIEGSKPLPGLNNQRRSLREGEEGRIFNVRNYEDIGNRAALILADLQNIANDTWPEKWFVPPRIGEYMDGYTVRPRSSYVPPPPPPPPPPRPYEAGAPERYYKSLGSTIQNILSDYGGYKNKAGWRFITRNASGNIIKVRGKPVYGIDRSTELGTFVKEEAKPFTENDILGLYRTLNISQINTVEAINIMFHLYAYDILPDRALLDFLQNPLYWRKQSAPDFTTKYRDVASWDRVFGYTGEQGLEHLDRPGLFPKIPPRMVANDRWTHAETAESDLAKVRRLSRRGGRSTRKQKKSRRPRKTSGRKLRRKTSSKK